MLRMKRIVCIAFLCIVMLSQACSLFRAFPSLEGKIAYIPLCDLPTPLLNADNFAQKIGHSSLYIKRDDLTGKKKDHARLYGGNKVRKLEWLFADALQEKAQTIVTYGCVGSNHALATAVHARELNLKTVLLLKPQPNSRVVRDNLMHDFASHARLLLFSNNEDREKARREMNDPFFYFIPTGGSNKIGALGFVNAACELYEQIKANVMPEPDRIYIPIGSCGTAAGLLLGMQLNNSKAHLIAVAVEPEGYPGEYEAKTKELFMEMSRFLHDFDSSIPLFSFPTDAFELDKRHASSAYGLWTYEDVSAIQLMKATEGIQLEGTYSAKPVTAFMHDVARGFPANETVLIWNTYCGLDFVSQFEQYTYTQLPEAFHEYFEKDTQSMDKALG